MAETDSVTLAVVVARLDDLRSDLRAMRAELTASRADMVSRGEWEQRNRHVDARHQELGREIAGLRTTHATDIAAVRAEHDTDMRARHLPWPSVVAAIASVAAIVIALIR